MTVNLDKNSLIYLGALIGIALILWVGLFYYFSSIFSEINVEFSQEIPSMKKEITKEMLNKFNAEGPGDYIPKNVMDQFNAATEGDEIGEDILNKFKAK